MNRLWARWKRFGRNLGDLQVWWLTPMLAVLLALGILIVFAQSSAAAPFICTLF